jgi:CheY-specific phosphatase CheX
VETTELADVVRSVWESTLLPGEPLAAEPGQGERAARDYEYVSCIDIGGAFRGALSVECDEALARAIAAGMFARSEAELDEHELCDALREAANLIAGNVKGLLALGCSLSLPRATKGSEALLFNEHQRTLHETNFASCGRALRVRVLADGRRTAA